MALGTGNSPLQPEPPKCTADLHLHRCLSGDTSSCCSALQALTKTATPYPPMLRLKSCGDFHVRRPLVPGPCCLTIDVKYSLPLKSSLSIPSRYPSYKAQTHAHRHKSKQFLFPSASSRFTSARERTNSPLELGQLSRTGCTDAPTSPRRQQPTMLLLKLLTHFSTMTAQPRR